ncbi:MAG: hypothetical protein AAGI37_04835 [Planctomycetota bacterium]
MQPIDMTPHLKADAEQAAINAQRRADYEAYAKRENEKQAAAVKAIGWRTQMNAFERELIKLKSLLRHNPQNEALREEIERVEAAYKELRDECSK